MGIDVVEGFTGAKPAIHFRVNGGARDGDIEGGFGAARERANPRRIITFVRTADKTMASSQGADDFRAAGE